MPRKNRENTVVGSCVRAGLERANMQQTELAQRIGIHPSTLNQMISGSAPLSPRRFYQIAKILSLTQDEINAATEYYRNKMHISPEQSRQIFAGVDGSNDKKLLETALKGDKFAQKIAGEPDADFIKARIDEIYAQLDRAERAEMLAAAERILEKRKG